MCGYIGDYTTLNEDVPEPVMRSALLSGVQNHATNRLNAFYKVKSTFRKKKRRRQLKEKKKNDTTCYPLCHTEYKRNNLEIINIDKVKRNSSQRMIISNHRGTIVDRKLKIFCFEYKHKKNFKLINNIIKNINIFYESLTPIKK